MCSRYCDRHLWFVTSTSEIWGKPLDFRRYIFCKLIYGVLLLSGHHLGCITSGYFQKRWQLNHYVHRVQRPRKFRCSDWSFDNMKSGTRGTWVNSKSRLVRPWVPCVYNLKKYVWDWDIFIIYTPKCENNSSTDTYKSNQLSIRWKKVRSVKSRALCNGGLNEW